MKAYVVRTDTSEGCILAWAETPAKAKTMAFSTDTLNSSYVEWTDLRGRREPKADGFRETEGIIGDMPPEAECRLLRELGWHQCEGNMHPCVKCELYEWEQLPESKITDDETGWICAGCRSNAHEHPQRDKAGSGDSVG